MRIWMPLFGVAVLGVVLNAPTLADDGLLFGPPPLRNGQKQEFRLGPFEVDPSQGTTADHQTIGSLPSQVPGKATRLAADSAVPRRLPSLPGSAAAGVKRPAPVLGDSPSRPTRDDPPARLPADPGYTVVGDAPAGGYSGVISPGYRFGDGCGHGCGPGHDASYCAGPCAPPEPFRLFDCPQLQFCQIDVAGWVEQGGTLNAADPSDRFNGPVTFNDRSREHQMNQLYVYAERLTGAGYGLDVGGRADVLYGTDHRFTVSNGLEDKWNQTHRFYGLSVPQMYVDAAWNNLLVRAGHFYTIIGYETIPAPENVFYSHTYAMQYGEPFTHTGVLGIYDLNDCWCISAGVHRGWNQWEDNNDDLGLLGGITWTSPDQRASVAFAMTTSNEDDAGENNRFMYSLVCQWQLTCRLHYVLHHDFGYEDDAYQEDGAAVQDAEWYGIVNYLFYDLHPRWTVGVRHEWFADDDGVRVSPLNAAGGPPKGPLFDAVAGHYQQAAVGLNWTPRPNLLLRTECRWDWVDPLVPVVGGPFNDGQDRSQFLLGTDLIVRF